MGLQIAVTGLQVKMFCCHRAVTRGTGLAKEILNIRTKAQMNMVPCSGWSMGDTLYLFVTRK